MISLSPRQSCGNIAAVRLLVRSASAVEAPRTALGARDGRTRHAPRSFVLGAGQTHQAPMQQSMRSVNQFTSAGRVVFHAWASQELEGAMESRTQVAHYAATMTRELCRMCRKVELDDLAYLLEVAAAEAARVRATNGSTQTDVHSLHA
jgi:hypothetical protein